MFKCLECGHIFERGEETIWTEPHGEKMTGCPICKGAFAETVRCKLCLGERLEDELYNGLCLECLDKAIDYDLALKYFKARKIFLHFMCNYLFKCTFDADRASVEFTECMEEIYRRRKANDLLCDEDTFLRHIKHYILEEDGDYGKNDFSEWLRWD